MLDKSALEQAKQTFNDKFGAITILINGAGGNHPDATTNDEMYDKAGDKTFFDLTEEGVDNVFKLNYTGTFYHHKYSAKMLWHLKQEQLSIFHL